MRHQNEALALKAAANNIRVIRMSKNFSFEKVWCSYDHMSLSRDRIWHYFSMKPYTEIATATFVLDKNGLKPNFLDFRPPVTSPPDF